MFDRKELIELRGRAEDEAEILGLGPAWVRAYLRFADAADHLDGMIARTEVPATTAES